MPPEMEAYIVALMERSVHDAVIFTERLAQATSVMADAGMSADLITAKLQDDLLTNGKIFGELNNSIKRGINEGVNQSGRLGQAEQYPPGKQNYVWVTVAGHRVCPDCDARTGQMMTWDEWVTEGLPGTGWSFCGGNCYCVLDPEGKMGDTVDAPPQVKEPGSSLPRGPKVPKINATERIRKFTESPVGYWSEFLVQKYGSISFPGILEKHLVSIARGLEDTLGKFNLKVHHLGSFKTGYPRFRARGANGAAWGRGKVGDNAIGWRKTYISRHRATAKQSRLSFDILRQRQIDSLTKDIALYEKLKAEGRGHRIDYWLGKKRADLKRIKDKRFNKWSTSSVADDPLYATSKHESWHQIDYQLRGDGIHICGRQYGDGGLFKKYLDEFNVPRDDWYFVSEYAGSEIFELWAEVGTALDLGMYVPPNIKKAFIATMNKALSIQAKRKTATSAFKMPTYP